MNEKKEIIEIKEKIDSLLEELVNIMGCLETLENSLYFSSEREDKDLSKSFAKCTDAITSMIDSCIIDVSDIQFRLDKI